MNEESVLSHYMELISHEIRTPLSIISGSVGLLKQSHEKDRKLYLNYIEYGIMKLEDILETTNNIKWLNIGEFEFEKCIINTDNLVNEVEKDVNMHFQFHNSSWSLSISHNVERDLSISHDYYSLKNLLAILCGNIVSISNSTNIHFRFSKYQENSIQIIISDKDGNIHKNHLSSISYPHYESTSMFNKKILTEPRLIYQILFHELVKITNCKISTTEELHHGIKIILTLPSLSNGSN
jgi:K+-sensing histidine kinase KdpD